MLDLSIASDDRIPRHVMAPCYMTRAWKLHSGLLAGPGTGSTVPACSSIPPRVAAEQSPCLSVCKGGLLLATSTTNVLLRVTRFYKDVLGLLETSCKEESRTLEKS